LHCSSFDRNGNHTIHEINEFVSEFRKIISAYENNHPRSKIIDSTSPFHNKTVDVLIVDGLIKKLEPLFPNTEQRK
jgi:hypothetical protein